MQTPVAWKVTEVDIDDDVDVLFDLDALDADFELRGVMPSTRRGRGEGGRELEERRGGRE